MKATPRQGPQHDGIREVSTLPCGVGCTLFSAGRDEPDPRLWQEHAGPRAVGSAATAAEKTAKSKPQLRCGEEARLRSQNRGDKMAAGRWSRPLTGTGLAGVSCVPADDWIEAGPRNASLVPNRDPIGPEGVAQRRQASRGADGQVSPPTSVSLFPPAARRASEESLRPAKPSFEELLRVLVAQCEQLMEKAVASGVTPRETEERRGAGTGGRQNTAGVVAENLSEFYSVVYLKYLNTRDPSLAITLSLFHNLFDCCGIGGGVLEPFVRETCPNKGLWGNFNTMPCPSIILNTVNPYIGTILIIFLVMGGFMVMTGIFNGILHTEIKKDKNQASQEALPLHMHMYTF